MRGRNVILVLILVWAAALRLWRCHEFPRGLQIDEASNAWNAYCLLKTGQDEWGQRWPVFYTRAFDDYRSPLYLYLLLPFQAVGGMNVCTTRLPAAVGGVATILLVYYIGRRLFDPTVGLVAAAFVSLTPWHIHNSRWGHEGNVTPLLFAMSIASMLWAGVPCVDEPRRPRAWSGFVAGVVTGVACYGYAALRLLIPVTLLALVLVAPRCWIRALRQRDARRTMLAIAAGLVLTLGPLAWTHLTDPNINRRAGQTYAWYPTDPLAERVKKSLARYAPHFGPTFLFTVGSGDPALSPPPGYGWLHWYSLPLLASGVFVCAWRARASMSARVALAMLATYPAADLTFGQDWAPHPLRTFPGAVPMGVIAGVGAVGVMRWIAALRRGAAAGPSPGARSRSSAAAWRVIVAGAFSLWVLLSHAIYLREYFGPFFDAPGKYWQRHIDVMEACAWLKPRFDELDAVYLTHEMLPYPHVLPLVFLEYDPRRWFAEPREYVPCPPTLQAEIVCARFGKVKLMYEPDRAKADLTAMEADGQRQRVALILRPRQRPPNRPPAGEIRQGGFVWLYLYDLEI